jgi:bleomycin hydrolase
MNMTNNNDNLKIVELDTTSSFIDAFESDSNSKLIQTAVVKNGISNVAIDYDKVNDLVASRSAIEYRVDDWKITSQKQSGRCWLFSSLNVVRYNMRQNLGFTNAAEKNNGHKSFELSQNYAVFWDKYERSNYYLESVWELLKADDFWEDSNADGKSELTRIAAFLSAEIMGDGGQWNMAVNVYNKYGVVPKDLMPESVSSSSTAEMNQIIRYVLHKDSFEIAKVFAENSSDQNAADLRFQALKIEKLNEIYDILTTHLGTPPRNFTWSWKNAEGSFNEIANTTPQEFFKKYCTLNLDEYVCLVDDPRPEHPKNTLISVDKLGNIFGGDKVLYLNVDIELMKELTAKTIKSGEPVWMGCDVKPQFDRELGVWNYPLYKFSEVYGIDYSTTKEDRVRSGDSAMTHAMVFTGVGFDSTSGKPKVWRVENSWGDERGDKGFDTMDDSWFNEYMFEVAIHKSLLPADLSAKVESFLTSGQENFDLVLPAWDPMGSLA